LEDVGNSWWQRVFQHGKDIWLVVTGTWLLFFHILGIIIPTEELIFFRGVAHPPSRYENMGVDSELTETAEIFKDGDRRSSPLGWFGWM
jgi:hypothetical protein